MSTTAQKIKEIETEIARTQVNKATSYHLGQLRAKVAKLKRELLAPPGGKSGPSVAGFEVSKSGVASVGFVGFPSVGKSTLMSGLTGTFSEAAAYEFTTLTAVGGICQIRGAPVQIIDLPGIIEGAKDGKGRGRQVLAAARTCDVICIVLDVSRPLKDKAVIEQELEGIGIRLNAAPPHITIKKKDKGGISITNTVPLTKIDEDTIRGTLSEYKLNSCDVAIRCDPTVDELIDVIEGNRIYMPCIYILNKIDYISIEELDLICEKMKNVVPISSRMWLNIDELTDMIWEKMNLVRVYTKPSKAPPDYSEPVILRSGRNSVLDFCNALHKEIKDQFKIAKVYGSSSKHARGQLVGLTHELQDEDVITIYKR